MYGKSVKRIIISILMALFMFFEGAFSLPAFAQTDMDEEASEENTALTSEENSDDVEAMLIYDNEKITEEDLQEQVGMGYDGYIFKIRDDKTTAAKEEIDNEISAVEDSTGQIETICEDSLYKADSLETISEVVGSEDIEYIEPDVRCELYEDENMDPMADGFTSTPDDPYFINGEYAWPLIKTCAPDAWRMGCYGQTGDGSKVTVVVIDTGVASYHPDINYNRIDTRGLTYYKDVTESGYADEYGHGTFVTGVINAAMNNGKGVTGTMPGLNVLPIKIYKVKDNGVDGGYISDIIRALDKAIEIKADVVNMSFGTQTRIKSLDDACKRAIATGMILVSSVGNDELDVINYPAGCEGVIGVGSVSSLLVKAETSNYNSSVDCVAAGVGVMGLALGESGDASSYYKKKSGTSYAAPQVSALAGLAKSIDRSINAYDFEKILRETCRDLGKTGRDDSYGYGFIDYGKVAELLKGKQDGRNDVKAMSEPVSLRTAKIKTKYSTYTYKGKPIKPAVTVTCKGRTLVRGRDYTVKYYSNVSVGKATITVKGIRGYTGRRKYTYKIRPKSTRIYSCSRHRHSLKVKWSRRTKRMSKYHVTGYQVQVARNSKFTRGLRNSYSKGYLTHSKKFKKLRHRTRYYVRVRTYMKLSGKTYYSKWSSTRYYRTK